MTTYSVYNQAYGEVYANALVNIRETDTGAPAIVMAGALGGLLSSYGNATLDGAGNLSVYLDSSKTFTVFYNQFVLQPTVVSLAFEISRSSSQLSSAPTSADLSFGPGATFYLNTDPTSLYRISSDGTQFISDSSQTFSLEGGTQVSLQSYLRGATTSTPAKRAYWADDTPSANIHRFRDRAFFGDAVVSTGNRNAPYGNSQLTTSIGNWFEKNSQVVVESSLGKIGLLGTSCLVAGQTSGTSIGVAGVGQASLAGGTSRGLYGDATLEASATAVYAAELATANRGTDVTANPYSSSGGAYGVKIAHESAIGYLLGDSNTPAGDSTSPGTAAILIQAGSGGTSNHQYRTGMIFYSNSLVGNDGTTGTSEAIALGKGMAQNWYSGASVLNFTIRCDGTAVAGHDVAVIAGNDLLSFQSTSTSGSVPMLNLSRDTAGAGGVNYLTLANARTNTSPTWQSAGSDTNVGIVYKSKGTGTQQFFTNGGEQFRVGATVASPVNFLQAAGQTTGNPPKLSAQGSDADIDFVAQGKGTKGGQLQDGAGAIKFQWNTTGVGFNATAPVAKPTISGSRSANAALASLITSLASMGLCVDSTTA